MNLDTMTLEDYKALKTKNEKIRDKYITIRDKMNNYINYYLTDCTDYINNLKKLSSSVVINKKNIEVSEIEKNVSALKSSFNTIISECNYNINKLEKNINLLESKIIAINRTIM